LNVINFRFAAGSTYFVGRLFFVDSAHIIQSAVISPVVLY
jgi:hypothetical protein